MNQTVSESDRPTSRLDQLIHEYLQQVDEGKSPDRAALLRDHPDLADEMAGFFEDQDRIAQFAQQLRLEETIVLPSAGGQNPAPAVATAAGGLPSSVKYFGRYEILQEIARGGMGVIYKARQSRLDRVVALKMILAGQLASTADVSRFYAEAQAAANLEHPGIVPIYEVGQYGGQHYFSMAYVDGESLATRLADGPMLQREAAALVQQLCEAVQYAHQRGVIHRDLKPGNVLIDRDGRPRITDFGLAKQTAAGNDLTATGQVLGTPSYMPPEQAAGDLEAIGPAADVYSLGAVFYAALTGRPPFQAATPIATLMQVRNADPVSPRLLNPSLKKDLETICLKCLEKEPQRRYASAADMAEDLRRFLHDEPILARRVGPISQAARWVRKRRKTVGAVVGSAALAALLLIGSFLAWRAHEQSLLGNLSISTDGPSLVAEVHDPNDQHVAASFPVPMSQPVALPEGNYRVRLSSPGIVSQDYSLRIDRGANSGFETRLEDRCLWPPLELKPDESVEPVAFGKQTDLLVYRNSTRSLRRLDGATGKPVWPRDLVLDKSNLPDGESLDEWTTFLANDVNPWQSSWLASATVDLNHDGESDLILGSRRKEVLIAVSGKTGKLLWAFRSRPKPPGKEDLTRFKPLAPNFEFAPVIGRPVVDADGTEGDDARIIACFSSPGETFEAADKKRIIAAGQMWLECVSGKSGHSLWRYAVGNNNAAIQPWEQIPLALEAIGQPQVVKIGGRKIVVSTVKRKLYGVDLATGNEAWKPFELGFDADATPQVVGAGNGSPPMLTFASGRPRNGQGSMGNILKLALTAVSLAEPHQLWQTALERNDLSTNTFLSPAEPAEFEIAPIGPHEAPAIVAPVWRSDPKASQPGNSFQMGDATLAVFDPASGNVRWEKSLKRCASFEHTRIRWTSGPDLDGDGYREIFATWIGRDQHHGLQMLVVAAFSGKDGTTLWRWTQPGVSDDNNNKPQSSLCWWSPAENGWPKLVVPVARGPGGQGTSYVLDSADGRLLETLSDVSDPRSVDLNDDGLADLIYTVAPQGYSRLMAARGDPPIAWRSLDLRSLQVAGDFDGDGIADATADDGFQTKAFSGRGGRILWRGLHHTMNPPIAALLPIGEAGLIRPALLALDQPRDNSGQWSSLEVTAFAGDDGHRVWPAAGAPSVRISTATSSGSIGSRSYRYPAVGVCVLDRARPDVWLVGAESTNFISTPNGHNFPKTWLNILAGDTGRLRWKADVAMGLFGENGRVFQDEFQDLNGDGVADVVAWAPPADPQATGLTGWQLKAFSGADGAPLWPDAPPVYSANSQNPIDLPAVGDLDGKGAADIVFVRQQPYDAKVSGQPSELVGVDGRTGRVKWTWPWVNSGPQAKPPLLVDFDGSGRKSVCLYVSDVAVTQHSTTYQALIVVVDGAGKLRRRVEFKYNTAATQQFGNGLTWWRKVNVGDGKEGLLYCDSDALQAIGGERLESLWKWPLPKEQAEILDVLPKSKVAPATVALWSGKSVYGIAATTGKTLWRGEMPTAQPGYHVEAAQQVLMENRGGDGLPRLLTADGCRLTWPVDAEGRYQPPHGAARSYEPVLDEIVTRPLPWVVEPREYTTFLKVAVWTLLWLVVPVGLMRWAMKRRSWRLAFVPALYQIATVWSLKLIPSDWFPPMWGPSYAWRSDPHIGIAALSGIFLVAHVIWVSRKRLWAIVDASMIYAVAIALAWKQREVISVDGLFLFGAGDTLILVIMGLPILAAIAWPAIWIYRGQWRRLGFFLLAAAVTAAIFAAILLKWDPRRLAGDDESYMPYTADGWYQILAWGLYWAALLAMAGWLLKQAFRLCFRAVSRLRRCFTARKG